MPRQIIPPEQWEPFFAELSSTYQGGAATVEMVPQQSGPQVVTADQTFDEIRADRQGSAITIRLGETSDLTIESPLRVHSEPYAGQGGQIVEIESRGAALTRLYLSPGAGVAGAASREVGGRRRDVRGIGLGGVRSVGSGSLGERDLSGHAPGDLDDLADITDPAGMTVGPGSDLASTGSVPVSSQRGSGNAGAGATTYSDGGAVDVIDPGSDAPVLDGGADPIGGADEPTSDATDESDDMIEGEVGAQAERDLTELLGRQPARQRDPDDAELQRRLTELLEEDDPQDD